MINVICLVYITGSLLLWEAITPAVACIVVFILISTLLIIVIYRINKFITSYIITTLTVIFGGVIDKKGMSYFILIMTIL